MRILIVDDEEDALLDLEKEIRRVKRKSEIFKFTTPSRALMFAEGEKRENRTIDMAFLDIELFDMNGIALAKELKLFMPNIYITFVSGYSEYALETFQAHAKGYLLKPVQMNDIRREIFNALYETETDRLAEVTIHTFGNFEVFRHNRPLAIRRAKSKEILAYLIDRQGMTVKGSELAEVLWGRPCARDLLSQLRNILYELKKDLFNENCEDILIQSRTGFAIDRTKVYCDYFELLKGDEETLNCYCGVYMSNYSWGRSTEKMLSQLKQKMDRSI